MTTMTDAVQCCPMSYVANGGVGNCRHGLMFVFQDSVYDALFNNNGGTKVGKKVSSDASYSVKKAPTNANSTDDFSYLFGMGGDYISRLLVNSMYINTFSFWN